MRKASQKRETSIDLPALTLRAEIRPDSLDPETRTAELVFSTGARVLRGFFDRFYEELSLDPKHVRMGRLTSGRAPVLAAHDGFSLNATVGVVDSARLERGQGVATVRFAKDDEDADKVWNKIQQGILRNVSVGYQVHKFEKVSGGDAEIPVMRATDWEPYEVSIVPMGADADAKVRNGVQAPTNRCVIVLHPHKETRAMGDETRQDPTEIIEINPHDPGAPVVATTAPRAEDVQPTDRDAGMIAERRRIEGIIRAVRVARLSSALEEQLIRDNVPLVDAQSKVLERIEEQDRGPSVPQIRVGGHDPNTNIWEGIRNALLHRVQPNLFKLEENGRLYRGLSLMEIGKLCLQAKGMRTTGMSKMEVAGLALGLDQRAGYHTTSDFPNILADVANKTLRRAYDEAPATYQPFSRRVTLPDFKLAKRLQLGEAPSLTAVGENGEFTRGTIGEGKEQFQLGTFGKIFAITRKALVNDDTDAFSRITQLFGRAARDLESGIVWAQITANAAMGDGVALFHATHGNLSATSDAISVAAIGAGRAAMRSQKGLDAVQFINVAPRFLLVPVAKETLADQFVSQNLLASQSSAVNPFAGRLQVIAEPRLDANSLVSWYLAGSTDQIDIIEYAYLEGEEGPMVESRIGFDVDGLEIKCRHDFAAKVIDWRGLFKNPGA